MSSTPEGAVPEEAGGSGCRLRQPRSGSDEDENQRENARPALSINAALATHCGWRPYRARDLRARVAGATRLAIS